MSAAKRQRGAGRSRSGGSAEDGGQAVDRQQPWSTRGSRVERIDRVLVAELASQVEVRGPEAHHLRDVLRVRRGSSIEAFDGAGLVARGEVVAVDREAVTLELHEAEPSTAEPTLEVTLAVALLKGDKLSDVVRPATELGVRRFRLFVSRNCDSRELSAVRLTRLRRVAQEAARQSGRAVVPPVDGPVALDELMRGALMQGEPMRGEPMRGEPMQGEPTQGDLMKDQTVLVGDPAAEQSFADYTASRDTWGGGRLTVVTGPEGGLTDDEVAGLVEGGAVGLRLGPRILRADTAPVAMAAALLLGVGDEPGAE